MIFLVLLFFCFPLLSPFVLIAVASDEITLTCPQAQENLRGSLGLSQGEPITQEVIQDRINSFGGLMLAFSNISSLEGFEQFKSYPIKLLQIQGRTQQLDFSNIAELKPETLRLINLGITNVDFVSGMTELKILDLPTNNIDDLSGLENLLQLEELGLYANRNLIANNLTLISSLKNLKKLDITMTNSTNEPKINLGFLNGLNNLNNLKASYANIADISALANLNNLQELDLSNNYITDITPLASKTLDTLNIQNNYINVFSGEGAGTISQLTATSKIITPQYCIKPEKEIIALNQNETYYNQRINQYQTDDGIDFSFKQNLANLNEVDLSLTNNILEIEGSNIKGILPGSTIVSVKLKGMDGEYAKTNFEVNVGGLTRIEPAQATIQIGESQDFKVYYYNPNTKLEVDYTSMASWSSGDYKIVSPFGWGTFTGIKLGTATIKTYYASSEIEAILTVTGELDSLEITPNQANIKQGETQQYKATAVFKNGFTCDVTEDVLWATQNEDIAKINDAGLATGTGSGEVKISASYEGQTAEADLTVLGLDNLIITPTESTIAVGEWQSYSLKAIYSDSTEEEIQPWSSDITWEISDPEIATISYGNTQAITEGTTIIKATYKGKTAEATLNSFLPEGLTITPKNIVLKPGEIQEFKAYLVDLSESVKKEVTEYTNFITDNNLIAKFRSWPEFNILDTLVEGSTNIQGSYHYWDNKSGDMVIFTDTATITVADELPPEPVEPQEPVIPPVEPEIPPVIPSNPGSGGSYTEPETTVIVTPQAPEEPEIVEEEPEVEIEEEQEVIEEEPIEVTNPEPESNQTSLAVAKIPIAPVKYNTTQVVEEQPKGIIKGILKMKDGTPLSNARLELHSQPLTTYTDINGYFEFRDVELGSHILYLADANITDEKVTLKSVTVQDGNNSFQLNKIAEIIRGEAVEVTSVYLDKEELEKEIYIIAELSAAELSQPIEQNEVEEETQLKKVIMSILPLLIILLLLLIIILIRRRNRNEEY